MNAFARKVDPAVAHVVSKYTNYFTKPEAAYDILNYNDDLRGVANLAGRSFHGWGLQELARGAVEERVTAYVSQKVPSVNGVKVPLFESYAVGRGPRRWARRRPEERS